MFSFARHFKKKKNLLFKNNFVIIKKIIYFSYMSKSRFFPILFTFTLFLKLCHSSTCKYYISFSFLYLLLPLLDFVSQNGTQNGNGSEANPFPDMTTAINSTNDFDVTLVLFNSEVPYEFFQFFYSNITISIMSEIDIYMK